MSITQRLGHRLFGAASNLLSEIADTAAQTRAASLAEVATGSGAAPASPGFAVPKLFEGLETLSADEAKGWLVEQLESDGVPPAEEQLGWLTLVRLSDSAAEASAHLDRAFEQDLTALTPPERSQMHALRGAVLLELRDRFPRQVGSQSFERRVRDYALSWHTHVVSEFERSPRPEALLYESLELAAFTNRVGNGMNLVGADQNNVPVQLVQRALQELPAGQTRSEASLAAGHFLMTAGYLVGARTVLADAEIASLTQDGKLGLISVYEQLRAGMTQEASDKPHTAAVYESNLIEINDRLVAAWQGISSSHVLSSDPEGAGMRNFADAMVLIERGRFEEGTERLSDLRDRNLHRTHSAPNLQALLTAASPLIDRAGEARMARTAAVLEQFIVSHENREEKWVDLGKIGAMIDPILKETEYDTATLKTTIADVLAAASEAPLRPADFEAALELFETNHPERSGDVGHLRTFISEKGIYDLIGRIDGCLDTDAAVRSARGELGTVLGLDISWAEGDGSRAGGIYAATDVLSANAGSLELRRNLAVFRHRIQYEEMGGHITRDLFSVETGLLMVATAGIGMGAGVAGRMTATGVRWTMQGRKMAAGLSVVETLGAGSAEGALLMRGTRGVYFVSEMAGAGANAMTFWAGNHLLPGTHGSAAATAFDVVPAHFLMQPLASWKGVGGSLGRALVTAPLMTGTGLVRKEIGLAQEGEDPLELRQFLSNLWFGLGQEAAPGAIAGARALSQSKSQVPSPAVTQARVAPSAGEGVPRPSVADRFWQGFDAIGAALFPNAAALGPERLGLAGAFGAADGGSFNPWMMMSVLNPAKLPMQFGKPIAHEASSARTDPAHPNHRATKLADKISLPSDSAPTLNQTLRELGRDFLVDLNRYDTDAMRGLLNDLWMADPAQVQDMTGLPLNDAITLHTEAAQAREALQTMSDWNKRMKEIQGIADPRKKIAAEDALSQDILSRMSQDDAWALPEFTDQDKLLKMIVSDSLRNGEVSADPYVYLEAYSRAKFQTTWVFQAEYARGRAEHAARDRMEPLQHVLDGAERSLGRDNGLRVSGGVRVAPLSGLVGRVNASNPGNSFISVADGNQVVSLAVTFSGDPGPNPVKALERALIANDGQGVIEKVETRGNDLYVTVEGAGTFKLTVQMRNYEPVFNKLTAEAEGMITALPDSPRKAVKSMTVMGLMSELRTLYNKADPQTRGRLGEAVVRLQDEARMSRGDKLKVLEQGLKDLVYQFRAPR